VKCVIDTNVVACYLLGTEPWCGVIGDFLRQGPECWAPSSWEAELANVLWMATRTGVIDVHEGVHRLRLADALGIRSVPARDLWEGALARAVLTGHPADDTLFVELAARMDVPLLTCDEALLRRFPDIARRPGTLAPSTT
jgi:predicted nucleic acid-binding protein